MDNLLEPKDDQAFFRRIRFNGEVDLRMLFGLIVLACFAFNDHVMLSRQQQIFDTAISDHDQIKVNTDAIARQVLLNDRVWQRFQDEDKKISDARDDTNKQLTVILEQTSAIQQTLIAQQKTLDDVKGNVSSLFNRALR